MTENEMIERVAIALCLSRHGGYPINWDSRTKDDAGWIGMWWTQAEKDARTAIEAMRVPTEGMSDIGADLIDIGGSVETVWQAMTTPLLQTGRGEGMGKWSRQDLTDLGVEACRIAAEITGEPEDARLNVIRGAMYLIIGRWVGYHAIAIQKASGMDRQECVVMGMRLRSAGVLKSGKIRSEWAKRDASDGAIVFCLDAMTAAGIVRSRGRGTNRKLSAHP